MVGKVVSKFTNGNSDSTYFMNSNNLLLCAILSKIQDYILI